MRNIILTFFLSIFMLGAAETMADSPSDTNAVQIQRAPSINFIKPNKTTLRQFEKFEAEITISASYMNPFDPDEIEAEAKIECPDGKTLVVPAFYYQEYQRNITANQEKLYKYDEPGWRVRFTPMIPGKYAYSIRVQTPAGMARSTTQEFNVIPDRGNGFVHTSSVYPHYFQFDNRKLFFPIGVNLGWSNSTGTYDMDAYFQQFKDSGINLARVWMVQWHLALEGSDKISPDFSGIGKYNLENAYKLDKIIDSATQNNVYLILCLDSFSALKQKGTPSHFENNAYNALRGGPCKTPTDFFTSETAKSYYQKRLRYILARWGYSPQVMAWELWNEVDLTDGYNPANVKNWHQVMADYLEQNDPYHHLITTSFSHPEGNQDIWNLPEIDFVQTHSYDHRDTADTLSNYCQQKMSLYKKPHIYGEFGIDWEGKLEKTDKAGVYLHNGIWSSSLSGAAGCAMSWWWDSVLRPNNFFSQYSALGLYTKEFSSIKEDLYPLKASLPRYPSSNVLSGYKIAEIIPSGNWGEISPTTLFHIDSTGLLAEKEPVNKFIQGAAHKDLKSSHAFEVNYPVEGTFTVKVHKVSDQGILSILVDGKKAFTREFKSGPSEGEWKETYFSEQFKVYQNIFDTDCQIIVPSRKHTIELVNEGRDWIEIEKLTLTNYITALIPHLRIAGLQTANSAYFWLQNKQYNWEHLANDLTIEPVRNARFDITGLENGKYKLEWYDTQDGTLQNAWTFNVINNSALINVPELRTDIAGKLKKVVDPIPPAN